MSFPLLHTDRLQLVGIDQSAVADIHSLFSNEEVVRYYNLERFDNEAQASQLINYFATRFNENLGIRWGIKLQGDKKIIGTLGFNSYQKNHRANIGYDLQPSYWHKGYMSEALGAVIKYGFECLHVNRIEAEVMISNESSDALLSRKGFKKEGLLRDWMLWEDKHYDMIMYSLLKSEWADSE